MTQGSEQWRLDRCGRPTASQYGAIMAKGSGRTAYLNKVLAERLTGVPTESYQNAHMDRGHEHEPMAREAYEIHTGYMVDLVDFIPHEYLMTGCSPDGLVNDDGGVEIKSVLPHVQIATIREGGYPSEHIPQVQGNLWNTKRKWWDFISFSPSLPKHLRLYVYRVHPDPDYIQTLSIEVSRFCKEVDTLYHSLKEIKQ